MSSRTMVMVIAAVIVLFTIISVRNHFSAPPPEAPAAEAAQVRVLAAKRDLAPGAFIQPLVDLEFKALPEGVAADKLLLEGATTAEAYSGAVVRRSLKAGELIPVDAVMKSAEGGFMAAVLEPGKRAVSISVNITSGNAGFIFPGDRVDLLITHRIKTAASDAGAEEQVVTETFAHNVRVLAVDQQLDNPENKAILAKTITVEVLPRQAEQISVAAEIGKISMALVSNGELIHADAENPKLLPVESSKDTASAAHYTRDGDVSAVLSNKEQSLSRVRVIRGSTVEILDFYKETP
jgi:pilus assembly protein CpaB